MSVYRYRGHNRSGTGVVGSLTAEGLPTGGMAEFVEAKYHAGWRKLTVENGEGHEVGGIVAHPDTGRRVWWAWADAREAAR